MAELQKIPTAAEIATAQQELAAKIELVKARAVADINALIESLAAIGLRYELVSWDNNKDSRSTAKKRKAPHCSICGDSGHRAPGCPKRADV